MDELLEKIIKRELGTDGYKYYLKKLVNHWISIKDKLPEDQQRVLFYDKESEQIYTGYYEQDAGWDFVDDGDVGYGANELNVTHWMLLPEIPEVK